MGMKLPGGERAIVDIAKLRDYCLNDQHPRGRHKARVFASALGLTVADADVLRQALLGTAREGQALESDRDDYGQRYVVDLEMSGPRGAGKRAEQLDHPAWRGFPPSDQLLCVVSETWKT